MNKLVILICILVADILTVGAQTSEVSDKQKGKYFEYTILENIRGAKPLFAIPIHENTEMIPAKVEIISYDWIVFSNQFVEQVLKKYLTHDEIRKMMKGESWASASFFFYFDYYGNIRYAICIFNNDLKDILTDENYILFIRV